MNKKITKYEIAKYEQELNNIQFKWSDIEQGFVVSDKFRNHDYEILESYDNKEDAQKAFKEYEMELSPWIQWTGHRMLRNIVEYELQENIYEIDEDTNELELIDYHDSEWSKIPDEILAEKNLDEMKRYRNFRYDSLDEFNEKLNEYEFYIDGKNTIEEVFEREQDEYNSFNVSYKYKNSNVYLHCQIRMDSDVNDNIYIDDIYFELD